MSFSIEAIGKTDVGLVRKNNEDAYGYDVRHGIFVVCDGMGGQAAGEIASKIAVDTVISYFRNNTRNGPAIVGRTFEGVSIEAAALANAIQLANLAIQEAVSENRERTGMGSTIVAVRAKDNLFSIAHVGDSRIYLIRGDNIQQLTNDHSLVMEQVRRGLISVEQAEHSGMQNVIVRALGSEDSVEPDLADHEFVSGDTLVLCCDGLSRFVTPESMRAIVGRATILQEACDNLITAAKDGGSDDNITCVCIRAVERSWHQRLTSHLLPLRRPKSSQNEPLGAGRLMDHLRDAA